MIVRSGTGFTASIYFDNGNPDDVISYRLLDPSGTQLASGAVPVPDDAVSINLSIPGELNLVPAPGVVSYRDLEWSYTVDGVIQNGETRYTLEIRLPFGVSADGVRAKLGVSKDDLPDGDIPLARAYLSFRSVVGEDLLAAMAFDTVAVTDAIEAQAALSLIPTMSVRVAASEDSGTNAFKRQKIDWDAVAAGLAATIDAGYLTVLPTYNPTAAFGDLFITVTPATDAITGETS